MPLAPLPGDLSWDLFQGRTQSSPSKCLLAMDAISTYLWDLCSKQPAIHVIPRDRAVGTYTGHHAGSREIVAVLVCFFFSSAAARLGNVAVVPMRPASLQPYEERRGGGGGSFVSVPDVLGWFGRFFYLAFFFLHCLTRDEGDGQARGRRAWWFGGVGRGERGGDPSPLRLGRWGL